MAEQQQVTVREIAEIVLGNPQADAAMRQELTNAGIKIGEDWAGRPAVSQADARRYVGDVVSRQRAAEAEYLAGRALEAAIHNAQKDRDELYERSFIESRRSGASQAVAVRVARGIVADAEKDLPRDVRKRLGWTRVETLIP